MFSLKTLLDGMAAGLIRSFAGVLAVRHKVAAPENRPELVVIPDFNGKPDLKLRLEADLSLRPGHLTGDYCFY